MKKLFCSVLLLNFVLTVGISQDMLDRKTSIEFTGQSLEEALLILMDQTGVRLSFSSKILPEKRIDQRFRQTPVREIIQTLLAGTAVRFQRVGRQVVLYREEQLAPDQPFTVSGFLREASTGEFIIGAYVQDKVSGRITYTNEYGFYSLTLPAGRVELVFSYQAHELERISFLLNRNQRLNLDLNTSVTLSEVVVVPSDTTLLSARERWPGMEYLTVGDIEGIPSLGGEPDILRTAHLLPGVQTGTDGVGGIFVRGGNAGHNLILIDGVPVYNISHAAGLFSIFNTNAIRSAKLLKGGFPARYGGRLSSVLDIRTKEGNTERLQGEVEAGLLSGRFTLEGPIQKGRSSFFFSGRRSLLNWYLERQAKQYKEEQGENGATNYRFHDLNFKVNHRFSDKDRLYLSYYRGVDAFSNNGQASNVIGLYDAAAQSFDYFRYDQSYSEGLDWGNRVGAMRWNHLFGPKLFANATLTYSNLNLVANYSSADSLLLLRPRYTLTRRLDVGRYHSSIEDIGGKLDFNWLPAPAHNVRFGASATHHRFRPGAFSLGQNLLNLQIDDVEEVFANDHIRSWEYALYGEDSFTLGVDSLLRLNIGLHASFMDVGEHWYVNVQPRLSVHWQWSERLGLKASGGKMTQFLHLLSSSSIGLPTDLWAPSTNRVKPEEAWQASAGFDYRIGEKKQWMLDVEAYYTKMDNLLSFSEGASFLNNWEENTTVGQGWAYGLDILLRKSFGKTTGWLSYSLARSERQFDRINLGRVYPFRYDRRHDFKVVAVHRFAPWIDVSANWVLSSGFAYSLALSEYIFQPEPGAPPVKVRDFGEKNQYRMPYYHRLDVGLNLRLSTGRNRLKHHLHLGVYNLYNRRHPLYYRLRGKFVEENNNLREVKEVIEVEMLPILPSLSYSFKF